MIGVYEELFFLCFFVECKVFWIFIIFFFGNLVFMLIVFSFIFRKINVVDGFLVFLFLIGIFKILYIDMNWCKVNL